MKRMWEFEICVCVCTSTANECIVIAWCHLDSSSSNTLLCVVDVFLFARLSKLIFINHRSSDSQSSAWCFYSSLPITTPRRLLFISIDQFWIGFPTSVRNGNVQGASSSNNWLNLTRRKIKLVACMDVLYMCQSLEIAGLELAKIACGGGSELFYSRNGAANQ